MQASQISIVVVAMFVVLYCIGATRQHGCNLLMWAFTKIVVTSYSWKTCCNLLLDLDSYKFFSMQIGYYICGCAPILLP
jgi:hypothetical protein